jgi:hypothetical protein
MITNYQNIKPTSAYVFVQNGNSWHIIILGIHNFEELIDHLVNEHGYDCELIEKGFTRVQEALDLLEYL